MNLNLRFQVWQLIYPKNKKKKFIMNLMRLYIEFNEGLDDLRSALDIDEQGLLDEALEGTFEDGGPKELRKFIDDLMKICFRIREERNNPKPPNNVKPVRFNKLFHPVSKKKRKEDINQLKMDF